MIPINKHPSDKNLLICILRFLSASGDEQLRELRDYQDFCQSNGHPVAHLWNPFVEIAEGLLKLPSTTKNETLSVEAALVVEEVECLLNLIFNRPDGCMVAEKNILTGVEWRLVRRAAKSALEVIRPDKIGNLSLYEILCHVAD